MAAKVEAADGKMVVLKPIIWNENNYLGPSGSTKSKGYPEEHGYGHEEWNGRPDWIWDGWRVFHTQAKGRMYDYAKDGPLGVIMTAMKDGQFHAVGVGCNVYENDEQDRAAIASALHLAGNSDELWALDAIRRRKKDRKAWDKHWLDAHAWVQWRCPQTHYMWFDQPIRITPDDLIPSGDPDDPRLAIVKMFGSYQAIRPDQARAIVDRGLPARHPILTWLQSGTFDPVRSKQVQNAPPPRVTLRNSASTDVDPYVMYLQQRELVVTPRHHQLQSAFEKYLKRTGADEVRPNLERVDLRYIDAERGPVLAEIKPTDPDTVRFALRAAIGQLLDYEQRTPGTPSLLIVIDGEPTSNDDLRLALDNGFGLAWRDGAAFQFRWPIGVATA